MIRNAEANFAENELQGHSVPRRIRPFPAGDDIRLDLDFLIEFNRDLDRNARPSRLNENDLEQRMKRLDEHTPICRKAYEHTRARLHELLLVCAANYANNCEYGSVGDLMVNPRRTLVHIRGRRDPVVKERHAPLSEQFKQAAGHRTEVVRWLRDEAILQTTEKPLIPHSIEKLETCRFLPDGYVDSARKRALQIADLSAFLCCRGFKDRLGLEIWLRGAGPSDRALVKSRILPIDLRVFREFGLLLLTDPFYASAFHHHELEAQARASKFPPQHARP